MRTKFITPKVNTFKKKKTYLKQKNELILISHNICVDGLSKQMAEEYIARYYETIFEYKQMESNIEGYTIQHYLTFTSMEKRGIELIYSNKVSDELISKKFDF